MDPISAFGATGSVVGIATFGLQLSNALYQYFDNYRSAQEGLQDIADGVSSTTYALEKIHEYLKAEELNQRQGRGLLLFSNRALLGLKETADKCLLVFWRIEATIASKNHRGFEEELVARLEQFNEDVRNDRDPCRFSAANSVSDLKLGFRGRLRWSFILPKLDGFNKQLQHYQLSLTLMCSVVCLGSQRSNP